MIPININPYIERRVFAPNFAADAAIDLLMLDLDPGTMSGGVRVIELSRGRLVLDGPGHHPEPARPGPAWPERRLDGWIVAWRGWYRVRVEIELTAWSETSSAIGMRPILRRASAVGLGSYLRIGTEAVERLRREIERLTGSFDPGRLAA